MPYNINTNFAVEQTSNLTDTMSYANGISFKLAIDKLKFANIAKYIDELVIINASSSNFKERNSDFR